MQIHERTPETTIKNAINCERGRLIHSQKEVQQQLTNSKNKKINNLTKNYQN